MKTRQKVSDQSVVVIAKQFDDFIHKILIKANSSMTFIPLHGQRHGDIKRLLPIINCCQLVITDSLPQVNQLTELKSDGCLKNLPIIFLDDDAYIFQTSINDLLNSHSIEASFHPNEAEKIKNKVNEILAS